METTEEHPLEWVPKAVIAPAFDNVDRTVPWPKTSKKFFRLIGIEPRICYSYHKDHDGDLDHLGFYVPPEAANRIRLLAGPHYAAIIKCIEAKDAGR